MPRFRLRTLLIVLALLPPLLAAVWHLSYSITCAVVWCVFFGIFALLSWRVWYSRFNVWVRRVLLLVVLLLAPAVYVLSSGPARWIEKHDIARSRLYVPYAPFRWLTFKSSYFRRFVWWYLEFWDEGFSFQSDVFIAPSPSGDWIWLGIAVDNLSPVGGGVRIKEVARESPAKSSGLQIGDVISEINHRRCRNLGDYFLALTSFHPVEVVPLVVIRDGKRQSIKVILTAPLPSDNQETPATLEAETLKN